MSLRSGCRGLLAVVVMAPAVAAEKPALPAVLDARAAVPPLVYRSPFGAPAGAADPAALSWREANERVARIGGWKAYAREAQQANPATPAASEPRR